MSHMRVAARGVEVLLPTPTPSSTALVANEPERLLAKAWKIIVHGNIYLRLNYRFFIPEWYPRSGRGGNLHSQNKGSLGVEKLN